MRIGVDASCWANGRGYGRFTQELMRAMVAAAPDDEFACFVDAAAAARWDLDAPNVQLIEVAQSAAPTEAASADGSRGPADLLRFSAAVAREPMDVFCSPSVYTYFPLPPRLRAGVTIHDAIAERFPELTLPTRRARLFWKAKVALAILQARIVLTVSNYAASELVEVLGIPRATLRVAVEAPAAIYTPSHADDIARSRRALGLPDDARWFTYVGGFSPHKRVAAIVRAHAALAASLGARAPYLLLVGAMSGDVFLGNQGEIRAAIEACGTSHLVKWTGFLADEDLRHVHSGALALVLPSLAEGFGLPAVEAAACGCPVIATTASPLPELLAGGGIFVDPRDETALEPAMRAMATNEPLRARMARIAASRAGALTWPVAADAALGALREAAA